MYLKCPNIYGIHIHVYPILDNILNTTVVPTKSDIGAIFCLQLLSKTLTCTLNLSLRESRDHLCINPILWIGLIHTCSINYKSLITL